jgi:hypothetical protein
MADLTLTHYIVRREPDRLLFLPSTTLVGLMTFGFAAVSAFMFYLSTLFFRHAITTPTNLFGPILLLSGCILAAWAIRAWRTRRTPLSIETGGRVSYGDNELCAPGTVRSVRIVESRGGDAGDSEVAMELADATMVFIPSRYFGAFKSREHARPFATKLAEALSVPVTEQR